MPRPVVETTDRRHLDDLAQVHDGHAVTDVLHDREVVGDEQVGQPELAPQVKEQVEDLRLDGDVERRDGLIADDEVRSQCQSPGDADALALTTAEFVGIAARIVASQPDVIEVVADALIANAALAPAVLVVGLGHESFADDVADRHARIQRSDGVLEDDLDAPAETLQVGTTLAEDVLAVDAAPGRAVAGSRRMSVRPRVDLPQPDSPTSPSTSPCPTSNVMSSTAWTSPMWRRNTPLVMGKYLTRA